jgi:hypothetical protein
MEAGKKHLSFFIALANSFKEYLHSTRIIYSRVPVRMGMG